MPDKDKYTALEKELIDRLRSAVGDNPTEPAVSGQEVDLKDQYIWTPDELYNALKDSFIETFKGKRQSFNILTDLETRIIILKARISLTYDLVMDSTRYVKYQMRDTGVEKIGPSELLEVAKALEEALKNLLEEAEIQDIGGAITVGVIRRYDQIKDRVIPSIFAKSPDILPWEIDNVEEGVRIRIYYRMLDDYRGHFIQKKTSTTKTVIVNYTKIADTEYIDKDVDEDGIYTYTLYVESTNNIKKGDEKTITYKKPESVEAS